LKGGVEMKYFWTGLFVLLMTAWFFDTDEEDI
jgi:hypothetical protein